MRNSPRCLFESDFTTFLRKDKSSIFGELCDKYHGDALTTTREAWIKEIEILQNTLSLWKEVGGHIVFEYDIPRLGKRIDVVLLLKGIVFCLEFKVGESSILENDVDQVLDYALDLKNFHKFSQDRLIVRVLNQFPDETPIDKKWIISPYAPTPTIIEAARTLYESHSVEDITRHEADEVTTDNTISYILNVIQKSKENGEKSICFVTGVPGAGKTLVGLDVAVKQTYQGCEKPIEDEGAVYLSGNGPLVAVLNEALAKDNYQKCKERGESKRITDSRREVEHVAIFDEAQRSWTHKRLADYLKRGGTYGNKLKVPNFPMSEAAFLIWSLDQREDWATIVCLVGGGQEINTGEAGISEWIKALNEIFTYWKV